MSFKPALAAISLLFVCSLTGFQAVAQDQQRTITPDAIRNAIPVIPAIEGQAYVDIDDAGTLVCGPASSGRSKGETPGFVRIDFSFGRSRSGSPIGSWAVRNVYLGPERIIGYLFGGVFTGENFDSPATRLRTFDLRGRVSDLGRYCRPGSKARLEARIWGYCGDQTQINLEIRNSTGVFASTTFRADSHALCHLTAESSINQTLNRP
jgi:hypothetical protein